MIIEFWDRLVARFDADTGEGDDIALSLPRLGRKLYLGFQGEKVVSVLPYVECHLSSDDTNDTFGSDLETFDFQFSCFTSSRRVEPAFELRKQMIRVFDDAKITDADASAGTVFVPVQMQRRPGGFGPRVVDGVYQTTLLFRATIQLTTSVPSTRWSATVPT